MAHPATRVVLVHGAYADGSSWSEVIPLLTEAGLDAVAVQHPLTTLDAGVQATQRALARSSETTVLVAHSYAGMIITQAGLAPNVSALVYVAARAPDAGEDYTALAQQYAAPPASAGLIWQDGYGRLSDEAFLTDFANGVEPSRARTLLAAQGPIADTLFASSTTVAAWRSRPSWYVVSAQDRTINPDLERFMAARMEATTSEVDAGHLGLVSHHREVAAVIIEAAGHRN
ncbi:alpha/beta fold hydrolase [Microbacterium sp. P04]|uniref:alpha/beta fold hydrolase n=1 Tax=Microbacterium sp. P04 TaxID=3366947 RepID=UPI003745DB69